MKEYKFDQEEKEILDSYERSEWYSVPCVQEKIKKYAIYAKATLRKDKRINIRISERDLELLQRKAIEEGIPYQTLISSLLHKYINGNL